MEFMVGKGVHLIVSEPENEPFLLDMLRKKAPREQNNEMCRHVFYGLVAFSHHKIDRIWYRNLSAFLACSRVLFGFFTYALWHCESVV